jgi:hypothetical protein
LSDLYDLQLEFVKAKEDIAKSVIIKEFLSSLPEAFNVSVKFDERYVVITYDIIVDEILYEKEQSVYDYSDDLENCGSKAKELSDYRKELRNKYPYFCMQNDYIQSNRIFSKTFKLDGGNNGKPFYMNGELCNYLKLPNTTSCSCGGGDYEIKRTPMRTKQFLTNISTCISEFEKYIDELKILQNGLQQIIDDCAKEEPDNE